MKNIARYLLLCGAGIFAQASPVDQISQRNVNITEETTAGNGTDMVDGRPSRFRDWNWDLIVKKIMDKYENQVCRQVEPFRGTPVSIGGATRGDLNPSVDPDQHSTICFTFTPPGKITYREACVSFHAEPDGDVDDYAIAMTTDGSRVGQWLPYPPFITQKEAVDKVKAQPLYRLRSVKHASMALGADREGYWVYDLGKKVTGAPLLVQVSWYHGTLSPVDDSVMPPESDLVTPLTSNVSMIQTS